MYDSYTARYGLSKNAEVASASLIMSADAVDEIPSIRDE